MWKIILRKWISSGYQNEYDLIKFQQTFCKINKNHNIVPNVSYIFMYIYGSSYYRFYNNCIYTCFNCQFIIIKIFFSFN